MTAPLTYGAARDVNSVSGAGLMPNQPFLTREDLAAIGSKVWGTDLTADHITRFLRESQPFVGKGENRRRGRYAEDPFVAPDGHLGIAPWWSKSRRRTAEMWFKRHSPPPQPDPDALAAEKASAEAAEADRVYLPDLAEIFGVKAKTISDHLSESRAIVGGKRSAVTRPGKWAHDPFPAPDDYVRRRGLRPWWSKGRLPLVREWFGRHKRRQVGDSIGGPKEAAAEPVPQQALAKKAAATKAAKKATSKVQAK